jgi:type I restriction enzyme S subunit
LESNKIQAGDILISLVGTYGRVSIVPNKFEPGIINPRLMKITLDQKIMLPEFFKYFFLSKSMQKIVSAVTHGGTMQILNVNIIKKLPIFIPPLSSQKQIVAQLDKEMETLKKIRELKKQAEERINKILEEVWGK